MSFNENFVVRNGLEVATNLIYADYVSNKVGIGTTVLTNLLSVGGDIGGQNITISGISTVAQQLAVGLAGTVLSALASSGFVGVGTASPQYTLDIRSPVSTGQTALYVKGDTVVTGDLQATNISFSQANVSNLNVSGITTLGITSVTDLNVSGVTTTLNLNVTGVTTLGITSVTNLNVSDITTTSNLNVTGVATVGFITATNSYVSGTSTITTAVITNLTATNLTASGGIVTNTVSELNVTGITSTQNLNVLGVSTFVGIATFNSDLYIANSLNVGSGSTSTFLSDTQFKGYLLTVGNTTADEIIINSSITSNLIPRLDNTYDIGTSTKQWKSINVGNVEISSGVVTAVSGIVTYYGDGSKLQNVISGVGIATEGGTVGSGVTFLDLRGSGISTVTVSSGIATINIEGGGGGSIGTTGITTQTFFSNPNIITESYTLDNLNHNYGMFGPVSVGATITVGVGNTFVIV